jgi:hypothetical protein
LRRGWSCSLEVALARTDAPSAPPSALIDNDFTHYQRGEVARSPDLDPGWLAGMQEHADRELQRLLRARNHDHLVRGEGDTASRADVRGDRVPQRARPGQVPVGKQGHGHATLAPGHEARPHSLVWTKPPEVVLATYNNGIGQRLEDLRGSWRGRHVQPGRPAPRMSVLRRIEEDYKPNLFSRRRGALLWHKRDLPPVITRMKNERQHFVRNEMDERIPRGPRGSAQNELRMHFNAWRLHGLTFEESVVRATEVVRRRNPAFVPMVLPRPADVRAQPAAAPRRTVNEL